MSARWILIGVLTMLGAAWLSREIVIRTHLEGEWLRYILIGPAVLMGALLGAFAAPRPWREPLLAAVATMFVSVAVLMMVPRARELLLDQWHQFVVQLAIASAAAMGGAALVRWAVPRFKVGPASIVLLGGLVTIGFVTTMFSIGAAVGIDATWFRIASVVVGMFLGGFLAQGSITTARPWLCGSGSVLLLVRLIADYRIGDPQDALLPGGLIGIGLGRWGARVAWKRMVARGHRPEVDVPAAHIS